MKLLRNRAMQDDFIRCVSMVGLGVYFAAGSDAGRGQKGLACAGLLAIIVTSLLSLWKLRWDERMTPEEKREAKREQNDERSRMIQDRAMRNCWGLEDALLLIATLVFLFRSRRDVYIPLYLVLTCRELVCIALRWWLERKY